MRNSDTSSTLYDSAVARLPDARADYPDREERVEVLARELDEALEQQRATSEVLPILVLYFDSRTARPAQPRCSAYRRLLRSFGNAVPIGQGRELPSVA